MLSIFNRFQKIQFQILVLDTGIAWHIKDLKEFSNLENF